MGAEQSHQLQLEQSPKDMVTFKINDKMYTIKSNEDRIGPETMLVDYIRDHAGLKGTKYMCREGGCGLCVVTAKSRDMRTGEEMIRGVNSCLVPILACDGWEIMTIEHLGNIKDGLHPIQQRFMKLHGTQCGFCTPGWIMNTFSMTQMKKSVTVADVEDCTDGNICRCTGYRPILDAMKSLAMDAPEELKRQCVDMDDCCGKNSCCRKRTDSESLTASFDTLDQTTPVHMEFKYGEQWVKVHDMKSLFMAVQKFQSAGIKFKVLAGNTGAGVYKKEGPYQGYVELNSVLALRKVESTSSSLILGGAVTIAMAIEALEKHSSMEGFEYFKAVVKHWKRVANVSVRNLGTLAGNLMLKHMYKEFPSDIFLVLETVGAMVIVASSPSIQKMFSMQEFLDMEMYGKIIYSIHIPRILNVHFRSFKITRRFQNAHAYVNAAFLMDVDMNNFKINKKPSIVYGGIAPEFVHAKMTEELLEGKTISEDTIKEAMATLEQEVQPNMKPPDAHPTYRKALTKALLYKVLLGIMSKTVNPKFASGSIDIEKKLTTARRNYEFPEDQWPLYQEVPKIESPIQCTGEAEYVNDMSPFAGEVHGAVVVSSVANARFKSIDTSEALKFPGVVAWIDYRNIPGENNYMKGLDMDGPDVVFLQDKVRYAGEPIGAIIAETREAAFRARNLIKIEYDSMEKPILDIPSALEKAAKEGKLFHEHLDEPLKSKSESLGAAPHNFKGEFRVPSQLHFPMEPQTCVCLPRDECMDVFSATQSMTHVQRAVANVLGLSCNEVNVFVRRLGGGFGNKLARSAHLAAICAVSANTLRRPVRFVLDMETTLELFGKRLPHQFIYEVGFDDMGKIWNLDVKFVCDTGSNASEATNFLTIMGFQNAYKAEGWSAQKGHVYTNTAPNFFCRAPGLPKATACIETIMDRIAWYLKKDPMEVRVTNFLQKGDIEFPYKKEIVEENLLPMMIKEMSVSADIPEREKFIEKYNSMNRWKKRGLAILPSRIPIHYVFSDYKVYIAVYGHDGTVAVCHSAIEMGQGVSTKIAQVVANELKVPYEKVKVKPTDSFVAANGAFTGTGVVSENICYAAWKAAKIMNERLEPVKAKVENPTWENVAAYCLQNGMDLTSYATTTYADQLKSYELQSLAVSEVEIDCLTGEFKIIRSDIMSDIGYAISPGVDIGQIEGAYCMGLGYFLQEKVQYHEETGELVTNRTWEYKPPLAKDLPEDFRLFLLKKSPNPFGVLRSKATGEPAFTLSFCVVMALRRAITAARMDAGNNEWFEMYPPITPEDVQRLCLTEEKDFSI